MHVRALHSRDGRELARRHADGGLVAVAGADSDIDRPRQKPAQALSLTLSPSNVMSFALIAVSGGRLPLCPAAIHPAPDTLSAPSVSAAPRHFSAA